MADPAEPAPTPATEPAPTPATEPAPTPKDAELLELTEYLDEVPLPDTPAIGAHVTALSAIHRGRLTRKGWADAIDHYFNGRL